MKAYIHNFRHEEHFRQFYSSLSRIAEKDSTFTIDQDRFNLKITIEVPDSPDARNLLHRKCVWFVKNLDKEHRTAIYEVTG